MLLQFFVVVVTWFFVWVFKKIILTLAYPPPSSHLPQNHVWKDFVY